MGLYNKFNPLLNKGIQKLNSIPVPEDTLYVSPDGIDYASSIPLNQMSSYFATPQGARDWLVANGHTDWLIYVFAGDYTVPGTTDLTYSGQYYFAQNAIVRYNTSTTQKALFDPVTRNVVRGEGSFILTGSNTHLFTGGNSVSNSLYLEAFLVDTQAAPFLMNTNISGSSSGRRRVWLYNTRFISNGGVNRSFVQAGTSTNRAPVVDASGNFNLYKFKDYGMYISGCRFDYFYWHLDGYGGLSSSGLNTPIEGCVFAGTTFVPFFVFGRSGFSNSADRPFELTNCSIDLANTSSPGIVFTEVPGGETGSWIIGLHSLKFNRSLSEVLIRNYVTGNQVTIVCNDAVADGGIVINEDPLFPIQLEGNNPLSIISRSVLTGDYLPGIQIASPKRNFLI